MKSLLKLDWRKWKFVEIEGKVFEIKGDSKSGMVNLVDVADDRHETIEHDQLFRLVSSGDAEQAVKPRTEEPLDTEFITMSPKDMPDHTREGMDWHWAYVSAWFELGYVGRPTARLVRSMLARVQRQHPQWPVPCIKSVQRWINRARTVGMPTAQCVAPRHDLKGTTEGQYSNLLSAVLPNVLEEFHYSETPLPIEEICKRVVDEIKLRFRGTKVPSLRTIRRRIYLDTNYAEVIAAQKGELHADATLNPRVAGPPARRPMEVLEIDHSPLDIVVVDTENGVAVRRPWVTIVIDRFTRMIVGFYIGYERPSLSSVLRAVKHAVFDKSYIKDMYPGIIKDWPCGGRPDFIVCDNGRELHAEAFKKAMKDLNTIIMWCPKRKPWFKGRVESFFRRLQGVIHTLPGTLFANYLKKGRYNSDKHAVMTLETLTYYITKYIVDVYHFEQHSGLKGRRPYEVCREAMKNHRVDPPYSKKILSNLLMQSTTRTYSRNGIRFENLNYSSTSPEWIELCTRRKKLPELIVSYDEDDISFLLVQDYDDPTRHVRIECQDMKDYATRLPMAIHKILLSYARKLAGENKHIHDEHLRRAKRELWEFVKQLDADYALTHPNLIAFDKHMKEKLEAERANENRLSVIDTSGQSVTPTASTATGQASGGQADKEPAGPITDEDVENHMRKLLARRRI